MILRLCSLQVQCRGSVISFLCHLPKTEQNLLPQAIERRLQRHMADEQAALQANEAEEGLLDAASTAEPHMNGHLNDAPASGGVSKAPAEGQAESLANGLRQPLLPEAANGHV